MGFEVLDTVVLTKDLPDYGLRSGDLGAIVQAYEPDGLEVEFVTASGRTQALITVSRGDVRAVRDEDLIAVRSIGRAGPGRLSPAYWFKINCQVGILNWFPRNRIALPRAQTQCNCYQVTDECSGSPIWKSSESLCTS